MTQYEFPDGIYTGYALEELHPISKLPIRYGPGSLVTQGWRLEGFWIDGDKIRGDGCKEFANGDVYTGTFSDQTLQFDGQGCFTQGGVKQEGIWRDGVFL